MGFIERLLGEEPNLFELWLHSDDDKGGLVEYFTKYALECVPGYSKLLCNVYLPYKGRTSEIDVLMIHEKGFFVFESKNYSGWIFGSADQKQWTQCLANKEKHRFYNPILQNSTHIKALTSFLCVSDELCKSYIIISKRCELKSVPKDTEQFRILNRADMLAYLKSDIKSGNVQFSPAQIDDFYNKLLPCTQVSEEVKQEHISTIKSSIANTEQPKQVNVCPRCGSALIERNGKFGKFLGCSSYSRCRYTLNLNGETDSQNK